MPESGREPWPRLSEDLTGPRRPDRCRSCGAADGLRTWREHDDDDAPRRAYVVLCRACAVRLIDPHPRLYSELATNEPAGGAMRLCLDCSYREGTRCAHPDSLENGGDGIEISITPPIRVHVQRYPRRLSGYETLWRRPAHGCSGRRVP